MAHALHPPPGIKRVLIEADELAARVRELGGRLTADYADREPVLVGVLTGAVVFFADLMRAIDVPLQCEFMGVSSYGTASRSSGIVKITADLTVSIENRDVLVVEDIIDTGRTISYLRRNLETRHPRSLRICTLLDKIERREVPIDLDYVGFTIPNEFVVGYGLDHAGLYRNLPYLAALDLGERAGA
ncbi:MAG TPA: hypoxanthine phosphoribosyltransferase [Methylomirabilota bacterium]|nr:hypoxanthine phosphoribosyltransferase [Methylomirabilota bacterium]